MQFTRPKIQRRWVFPEFCPENARALSQTYGLDPVVGRILSFRQHEPGQACADFLGPSLAGLADPFSFPEMTKSCERVLEGIAKNEHILVFGDYDVDGISASSMLVETLRFLGADPAVFMPHRRDDGYGMKPEQVETFAKAGFNLIITVDTGITAVDSAKVAEQYGVTMIVTDHHLAGEALPDVFGIVNPNVSDFDYSGGPICGAGVVFKFAHALLKTAGKDAKESKEFLWSLLDLAALGTIADCVPLVGENRILARHGLKALAESKRPGVQALFEVAKITERPLTTFHVGFGLGPRINACGRMDHPELAFKLLTTKDANEAKQLAEKLEELNISRRSLEKKILESALEQVEQEIEQQRTYGHVVAGEDYHLGVVGIVASRLVDQTYRPAIALCQNNGTMKGSARSIPGLDVHRVLSQCDDLLTKFGGHAQAAGLEVSTDKLEEFRDRFNSLARDMFDDSMLEPSLKIDALLERDEFSWRVYEGLRAMEPFGQDNPEPVLCLRGVRNAGQPKIVGQNHLKLFLEFNGTKFGAIGFRLGELLPLCDGNGTIDVCGKMNINEWQGRKKLEFIVEDLRPGS